MLVIVRRKEIKHNPQVESRKRNKTIKDVKTIALLRINLYTLTIKACYAIPVVLLVIEGNKMGTNQIYHIQLLGIVKNKILCTVQPQKLKSITFFF